ncbi:hypothetical protein F9U64_14285 [Gracilibacillus oryzae]|uniref:Uncharacterized protein n=1 Tax=Gracilibacillus oryzae TaxID=1672701 RepID=A0A7C8GSV8_9BACI|nr:hypothetical protein [Gracilibacillus oryzae]KAB8130509.1 hypothetical protein F9U64_14285 [Gracilibacillus oryzae]
MDEDIFQTALYPRYRVYRFASTDKVCNNYYDDVTFKGAKKHPFLIEKAKKREHADLSETLNSLYQ